MTENKTIEDLAIFGGPQSFKEKLHVGKPNIGDRNKFLERVNDILDRRYLANKGPLVKEFENKIADYLGVKHCISLCNGTIALEIAIKALEMNKVVIFQAFRFIATAQSIQW